MLPAQNRMTRSADFSHTVKRGVRAAQPDMVVHACRADVASAPLVGFVVAKSVGGAVQRHRVARRLRHTTRGLLGELSPGDQIVVRALPGSLVADSTSLARQLHAGIGRALQLMGRPR